MLCELSTICMANLKLSVNALTQFTRGKDGFIYKYIVCHVWPNISSGLCEDKIHLY